MLNNFQIKVNIFLYISLYFVELFETQDIFSNNCTSAKTCSECVAIWKECKWCPDEQFNGPSRCNVAHKMCFAVDPKSNVIIQQTGNAQLKPNKIVLDARAGHLESISVTFKREKDYPVDLYYLMDLSCTMIHHKNNLSSIGEKLVHKLKKTTDNFRIGFGTFVDKEAIPFAHYISSEPVYRECIRIKPHVPMEDNHGFINRMNLSSDTEKFKTRVELSKISGNFDFYEGTLDALMQVMVCEKEINWRNHSDKIIVVATDAEFHYAGNGKLGGIVIPNDGKCHLNSFGKYTGSVTYDYPTLHHIAEVAQKRKFNIIFLIHNNISPKFEILSNLIGTNARIEKLANNKEISNLLEDAYKKISTSVQLIIENQPANVEIEIWSKCPQLSHFQKKSSCEFRGKPEIAFELKVRLVNCTSVGTNTENKIVIGLTNMDDKVEIFIKELCQCDCEVKPIEDNSTKCSGQGKFSCGICTQCNGKRTGQICACDPERTLNPSDPDQYCRKYGDSRLCSGHGNCECQKCVCDPRWAGEHCDQEESECYSNNVECNNQGKCQFNQCECNLNFTGKFCDCILSNDTCITNYTTGEICYDRGECRCGKCDCNKQAAAFGEFCEKCPSCDAPKYCDQLISCVPELLVCANDSSENHKIIESKQQCNFESNYCENLRYKFVGKTFESISSEIEKHENYTVGLNFEYQCRKMINNCDVSYEFSLAYENVEMLNFTITNYTKICPNPVNLVKIGLGTFFAVLLIGVITIILWKILTDFYDNREYQRFLTDVDHTEFAENQNPLYRDAKTRVKNPIFSRVRNQTIKFIADVFTEQAREVVQIPMDGLNRPY